MLKLVESDLKKLEIKFVEYLLTPNKPTNQILEHIFSSGGKRIRPALFLLCCNVVNYHGEHKYPIAAVCEYIHTASLLHDDVIDNSTLRRNKPTVNSVWGDETAVLSGDLIYSAACRLMVKTKNLELIDCFAECIRFMSESELFQLDLLWNKDITVEQYEKVVLGKTATLFEASCKTPSLLNDDDKKLSNLFADYGRYLGYCFQIVDDCFDYVSIEKDVGKPVVCDLLEGKVTLPVIYSLQKNNYKLNMLVSKILETGEADIRQKHDLVLLVTELGGLALAEERARYYNNLAKQSLNEISNIYQLKNTNYDKDSLEVLYNLVEFVQRRKN